MDGGTQFEQRRAPGHEHSSPSARLRSTLAARGAAADDDIVDFGIAGEVTTTVQVKGSASASCNELHPGEAHKVFARLAPGPGRQAFLSTNRLLSIGLLAKCVETDAGGDLWKQWSYLSDDTSSEGSGADQVIRLDERTLDELAESIASSVREFRRCPSGAVGGTPVMVAASLAALCRSRSSAGPTIHDEDQRHRAACARRPLQAERRSDRPDWPGWTR
jgi:hypothetical protein